ncbi:heat repeat-containing protein : HEAT repeat-containing protein OS=Singulisphaera acidiphila (strain ATCC BAA-1392 / DSM 18658 / VKM B-2454 / MOB10) GN=Sinac_4359 PE=4 SV=1: HEAT_2 [Gemmata massiliana]|uniref:Uncharacterized protein n=1 Tax=Gemmata massiliana TaxID=1210884 RepID=A0A6P2DGR9_9BACT|nr:HEAT repeat domain-containing protein [Gemmata massiliana]VTS00193.1 heat repeat-containing protein : HEAT repeat-containing protein OS=Singulisphaera acidiphila (strain ATCC BAA-1392 / DSM 18658 / VKM B-2454 / MOB10) GN=Sinac_4359 PE=4 SV=1: HEAT_2 [Gemmata massiliana]
MNAGFDPMWSTNELISFALSHPPTDEDNDPHYDVIHVLRERGTREVFDAATRLLASACPMERALGVNIHAQLGYKQDKPFAAESVQLLANLLETEENEDVIYAALMAFGHLYRLECLPSAVRFASYPDDHIRYGVTCALAGLDDERAIATLIVLTGDTSALVRDWATFALGSQTEWDSLELRAALWARTADVDDVTRGEALKGLAHRRDARAAEAIVAELDGPDPYLTTVEAAEILADPGVLPALERLRVRRPGDRYVERAIAACATNG